MAEITAGLVKELREKSGVGMMDCKKALQENGGDIDASMDWLRTKGLSKAAKKADRVTAEGLVVVSADDHSAVAVEVNAETDFVARNELFQTLARNAGKAGLKATSIDEVISSVQDEVTNLIATIGENMVVRRMAKQSVSQGVVASYIHNSIAPDLGRIAVLVAVELAADPVALKEMGRKIAMHIAATQPLSLSSADLDPEAVERERVILMEKAREEGKPEAMLAKIVEGQVAKFQREVVLLMQPFVMNPDQTVEQMIEETAQSLGSPITITGFSRIALGEGIEKKVDDFAAEVAAMTGAV